MEIFKQAKEYEQVIYCSDQNTGLKAIIAVHNTTLGPALGGTRMWHYTSEAEALTDVLRLSRQMSLKAAAAGLNLGGGKAVIMGNSQTDKTAELLRAFGRHVERLGGYYITAPDVGTCEKDMDQISRETKYVVGTSGGSGNPAPYTAYGVFMGMKAACKEHYGTDSLRGLTVGIQGSGSVGYYLCKYLREEGANLLVTDINRDGAKKTGAEFQAHVVEPDAIFEAKCHIFAPCALGGALNDRTIPLLQCEIIAGCANNVLEKEEHGELLHKKGIVYIPDYIINAGGLINVAEQLTGYNHNRVIKKVENIYKTVIKLLRLAKDESIPPSQAAEIVATERIK